MNVSEEVIGIDVARVRTYGVLHRPSAPLPRGVVMLGRVGVDRQSVLWARTWSQHGIPVLRFDMRGRGDNEGPLVPIAEAQVDLKAVVDAFQNFMPEVKEIVIWGMSEGASVALLYAPNDPRVAGLAVCNPWLRADRELAQTFLWQRLMQITEPQFWARVRRSEGGYLGAARTLARLVARILRGDGKARNSAIAGPRQRGSELDADDDQSPLRERLLASLGRFHGNLILFLSGDDPHAAVFRKHIVNSPRWRLMEQDGRLTSRNLPEANHLFTSREWRGQVGVWAGDWLKSW
jgi:uncharacterized protein